MKTIEPIEIGQIIKAFRKSNNLTQFKLAECIGIDEKQLGKIERGVHYPSVPTFLKIIKTLNINIEIFYPEECSQKHSDKSELLNNILSASTKELKFANKVLTVVKEHLNSD